MPRTDTQIDSGPRDRLVKAACALIAHQGVRGVTARALADHTGLSPSAVNYHFGGRDGLMAEAFAAARDQAQAWWTTWQATLQTDAPPAALDGWLTVALRDLCRSEAFPSLTLRELVHQAARDGAHRALAADCAALAQDFWTMVAARFGLPASAACVLADFAEGLSGVHGAERAFPEEDAWLVETCRRFVARLTGVRGPAPGWDGWRRQVLAEARRNVEASPAAVVASSSKVLAAAAAVIGRLGLAGLTHRSVAAEAGVSLAAVSNPFPSRSALVRATFDRLMVQIRARRAAVSREPGAPRTPQELADEIVEVIFDPNGEVQVGLAAEELLTHVLRDPELRRTAIDLRASRGENSLEALASIPDQQSPFDGLDAHVFSLVSTGAIRAAYARAPAERRAWLAARQRNMFTTLFGF